MTVYEIKVGNQVVEVSHKQLVDLLKRGVDYTVLDEYTVDESDYYSVVIKH